MTTSYTSHLRLPIPDFLSEPWHAGLEASIRAIDTALYQAVLAQNVADWANATVYAIGDLVIDALTGLLWTCGAAHTSSTSPTTFATDRTNHPTYWNTVANIPQQRGTWLTATSYTAGDFVIDTNRYAVCLISHVSGTFNTDLAAAKWSVLIDVSTLTPGINAEAEGTIASAATTNIGAASSTRQFVTGVVGITSFGTTANKFKVVRYQSALLLTHNATSLILLGAANRTTAAGDIQWVSSDATGNWRELMYRRADGSLASSLTSASLAASVTDETGSGSLVFATAPVLTSPTITTKISPTTDDGAPLGDTTHNFSDVFLASGAVINWNAGDITITHSANLLAMAGASNGYTYDAVVKPSANDAAALGVSGTAWSDIFLASGGVIDFNASDVTITHGANLLTFAGASNGYVFDAVVKPSANDGAALGVSGTAWSDIFLASGAVLNFNASSEAISHNAGGFFVVTGGLFPSGNFGCNTGVAIPAGGTTGTGMKLSSTANFGIFFGSGVPTLSAAQGSLYLRTDGSSTSTRLYVNTNGSTTWTNVTTAA